MNLSEITCKFEKNLPQIIDIKYKNKIFALIISVIFFSLFIDRLDTYSNHFAVSKKQQQRYCYKKRTETVSLFSWISNMSIHLNFSGKENFFPMIFISGTFKEQN